MKILTSEDNKRTLLSCNMLDLCKEDCPKNIASCLIQSSHEIDITCIKHIIFSAINSGVAFFLTWGDQAEYLHDLIDDLIENTDSDLSHIVTTHHEDEAFEDVAWLFMHSTYFGPDKYRYLAIFQNDEFDKDEMIKTSLLMAVNSP